MKWMLIGFVVLLMAVTLALVALPDSGYVLIGYGSYSVETSLLVLLVVVVLLFIGLRIALATLGTPKRIQAWSHRRWEQKRLRLYNRSMVELAEGKSESAVRILSRLATSGQMPLAASLTAARTADYLGHSEQRDQYLEQARRYYPNAVLAVGLTQAELQLKQNELEQAQTSLTQLSLSAPRHPQVLKLRMQLYLQQEDWPKLRELLPELRRRKALDDPQWQQLASQIYRESLLESGGVDSADEIQATWKALPATIRQDAAVQKLYVEQLIRNGAQHQAERLMRGLLKDRWDQTLVYLYGTLTELDSDALQNTAEDWLPKHKEDAVLLQTLGKISLRNQLWGKARSYFEASISLQAVPETYQLLGGLLEQLDEPQLAADCYRQGIALASTGSSNLLLSNDVAN